MNEEVGKMEKWKRMRLGEDKEENGRRKDREEEDGEERKGRSGRE
jgi:hypothetical protein